MEYEVQDLMILFTYAKGGNLGLFTLGSGLTQQHLRSASVTGAGRKEIVCSAMGGFCVGGKKIEGTLLIISSRGNREIVNFSEITDANQVTNHNKDP